MRFLLLAALAALLAALALPGSAAAAEGTASISGKVTDAVTEAPVEKVDVVAFGAASGGFPGITNAAGEYELEKLPADSYVVGFFPPEASPSYVVQFWDHTPYAAEAAPVTLEEGEARTGIDASLEREGRISGTVTDATTGAHLTGVAVIALRAGGGQFVKQAYTEDGAYTLRGLPPGEFDVEFSPLEEDFGDAYLTQYWDHVGQLPEAKAIDLAPGSFESGIDAALQPESSPTPTAPVVTPPAALPALPPIALPSPAVAPVRPKRCHKGFRRRKVHGKRRCVRVKKHHHRHRKHSRRG